MGVKRSFKQILTLMAGRQAYTRGMSVLMAAIMFLQLAVTPVKATGWLNPAEQEEVSAPIMPESGAVSDKPVLRNTFALVVATGGQPGDAIQYFKVVYEDANGIRRSEYIFREDIRASFEMAQEFSNGNALREKTDRYFNRYARSFLSPTEIEPLQTEKRDTYLFETIYDVKRIVGVEIMQDAGQWDCQGLWIYQVDRIYGEEMYGYVSEDAYISFSGWRLAELEMNYRNGEIVYTTLQNSRPKLYRMGENGHPEFNLITYDQSEAKYDSTNNTREYAMRLDITDVYGAGIENYGPSSCSALCRIRSCSSSGA